MSKVSSSFDHDNDIQYNGYLLYMKKLINARTYEVLIENEIKILLPVNFDMNRKNKILQNKKEFGEYKLNFKEYHFVDGFNSLIGINKAFAICGNAFKINSQHINAAITLFGFQVFTIQDALDILSQSDFKKSITVFSFLDSHGFLLRIDDRPDGTLKRNRVYCFSEKGFSMVKMFYNELDKTNVFDFKFKTKKELLIDNILKKYENG